jgi:hypothetical protein
MRQCARRPALIAGLVTALLAIACGEALAQKSRLYEFGPDAVELLPRRPAERTTRPPADPIQRMVDRRPCVLASTAELRLPPPPDDRSTAAELRELKKLMAGDDPTAIAQIRYWDTGALAAPWRDLLAGIGLEDGLEPAEKARGLLLMQIAIHDGLIAAWDSKLVHRRPRPDELDGRLAPEVAVPAVPSYPSEHAVVAAAAAGILAFLFPAHADRLAVTAEQAAWSRVAAGAVFPSDARAGLGLGRAVALRVIEVAKIEEPSHECGR